MAAAYGSTARVPSSRTARFDNNTASGIVDREGFAAGGGAYVWTGNAILKNSTFIGNTAVGGGMDPIQRRRPTAARAARSMRSHTNLLAMVHCTIVNNHARHRGRAFDESFAELHLVNNLIAGNTALDGWGLPQANIIFATTNRRRPT
jgi:hypothetical protein